MNRTKPDNKSSWIGKCIFSLIITVGFAVAASAHQFDNTTLALESQTLWKQIVEEPRIKDQRTAQEKKIDTESGFLYSQPGGEPGWGCPGWEGGGNTETAPLEPARMAFVTTHF